MESKSRLFDKIYGCIVGGTIGDAIGGPVEMLHYQSIARLFGWVDDLLDYGETCLFGHAGLPAGHCTDDSYLKLILCDAIIEKGGRITAEDWAKSWRKMFRPDPTVFYVSPLNAYFRLVNDGIPARDVGRGNMQANGSAMCIAPVGVINACNPEQAAYDTYEVASLLHTGMAREAAAAVSAAVAEAFKPEASPSSVLDAALAYLTPGSGAADRLAPMLDLARSASEFSDFTERFYSQFVAPSPYPSRPTDLVPEGYMETVDAMESVGAALGIFYISDGDPKETLVATANFGLDSDTIGSISGSVAGAFRGGAALPERWCRLVDTVNVFDHRQVAEGLLQALLAHKAALSAQIDALEFLEQAVN